MKNGVHKEDRMKKQMRLLLVDDHELVRQGLRRMLETEEDMEVVGECTNAEEVSSQALRLSPDIVLMDYGMPGMGGIEATRRLKRDGMDCDAGVIILADCSDYLVKFLEAGAAGYLNKNVKRAELAETIRQVYWSEHPPEERSEGFAEEAVELVISPPAAAGQTMRFIDQVEKRLNASTLQTIGSWDGGTTVTILLKPAQLPELLETLGRMPGVEKVEEELAAKEGFSGFLKRFRAVSGPATSARKRVLVVLAQDEREPCMAAQRLAAAFN